jgi:hypothetical protein
MASLKFKTGVESHPEIEVTGVDLTGEMVNFRWVGGVYAGDCSKEFVISTTEHGEMTLNQIIAMLSAQMVATLTEVSDER